MESIYRNTFDYVIGIDPGMNGGMAAFNSNKTMVRKNSRELEGMIDTFLDFRELGKNPFVVIEIVQHNNRDFDIPGKFYGMQKLFNHYHLLMNAVKYMGIPFLGVHPVTWQKELHLRKKGKEDDKERKNRYKDAAQAAFKDVKVTLWNSDALLLAAYGAKKFTNQREWLLNKLNK